MKKILFLICVLFGIGVNNGFAQTVDVYFNQPVRYHEIPIKHVEDSYRATANYIWSDGVGFATDTLNVTLGGNTFGEDSISEDTDFAGVTTFPDTLFNVIVQENTGGVEGAAYINATFELTDVQTYDLTLDGSWENANFFSTITSLSSSVDVTTNTYARADDGALADEVGPGTYGSVGNQFELMEDDNVSEIIVNFGASTTANTEYNISVYSTTSATVSTGTLIYTSPIQQVSAAGAEEVIEVDLSLTTGWYVIMVNQLTSTAFTLDAEAETADGQVIFFNEDGEFDRQDRGDVDIAITTEAPSTPEFTERVPGDEIVWEVGEAGSYTFNAADEDGDTPIFALNDTLPSFNVDWLTFTDNADGTATLTGTPDISNIGTIDLVISVKDDANATDSTIYADQFDDLTLRVVNSVAFEVPYTEDFDDVVAGEIPANWSVDQDVDGNETTDGAQTWREGDADGEANAMYIDEDDENRKQNEWLISPPLNVPAASGSESYLLKFDVAFLDGTESNFIGGNLNTLGSGVDGDGNFADITVWIQDESDNLVEVWNDNDNAEEISDDGDKILTPEIDLSDYLGQDGIYVIFQFESNNIASTPRETNLSIDNFIVEENNPFDLTVLARSSYTDLPPSQVDTTGGYDFDYWVINRGQAIPDDAEIVLSITSSDDDNFAAVFTETSISASDFTNDTLYNTVNMIPAIPDNGSSFTYSFEITVTTDETNSSTQTTSSDQLTIEASDGGAGTNFDNQLNTESGFTTQVSNDSDEADGLGNVIELVNDDYLAAIDISFAGGPSSAVTFQVDIIEVNDADATSGTVIATIDEVEDGSALNAVDNTTVEITDDPDFDSYLELSAGTYVILVTPTSAANTEIQIETSAPSVDPLTPNRADVGDFVRGDSDDIYRMDDDAGDIAITPSFSDYINYDVIAVNPYEQTPRTQIDFTNGASFETYVIKRGNSTADMVVTATIASADLDEDIEFENILGTSDFTSSDTVILQYDYDPVYLDNDATVDYNFTVSIAQVGTTNNNTDAPVGEASQTVTDTYEGGAGATAAFDNALGAFTSDGASTEMPEGISDGIGEIFTLTNDDYLAGIFVDFKTTQAADISVSIISVTDENATSGTVVAVIDQDDSGDLQATSTEIVVGDDEDFSDDIFLTAGTYVVMVNPVESPSWAVDVSEAGTVDKEDFGSFIRGNENNLYYDEEDEGNLDIRMLFRDNSAPAFFDPRGESDGVDINTSTNNVEYLITEGTSETVTVIVKDEQENDTFTAELVNTNLTWLTFNTTSGGFELVADGTADAGDYTAQVRAFDKLDTAFLNVSITIGPNPAPVFTTSPTIFATEGVAYSYIATGEDELGETVTASAELVPSWLTAVVSGDSITISGTPDADDVAAGTHAVKLLLTDASGNTAEQSFVIFVSENDAPEFATFPPTDTYVEGDEFYYRVVAIDAQGNGDVSYGTGTIPTGFTLTPSMTEDGVAELTSASLPAGDHAVVIEITDGTSTVTQEFTVVVAAANNAPTFTSTPNDPDVVDADNTYTYNVTATDADGDALQFSAPVIPSWAILINDGNGAARIIGDPNDSDAGDHAVTIEVTDGQATVSQSYTITVNATAEVEDPNDDSEESEVTEEEDVVADEAKADIFPIPAHNKLTVNEVKANVTIRIYNQAGRLVKSFEISDEGAADLDISDIQPGVYFLQKGDNSDVSRVIIR